MKEIYLDNSATTKVFPEVCDLMTKVMNEDYGNPSSLHQKGVDAEKYIREATSSIARTLKVTDKEILYTSGGTESDNLAITGTAFAARKTGMHIITTKVEHPAVLRTMENLEKNGFEVTYLGTDRYGVIDPDELKDAVRPDTILVSIMHVNNEIGAVMPVEKAGALIKSINPKTLFHVDAVQGYGKIPIYPGRSNIDLLSVSGHKIHGPKGTGFLYIKKGTRIDPILFGGGQQGNLRSGTENVPGIAGLSLASSMVFKDLSSDTDRMYEYKKYMIENLLKEEGVFINGVPAIDGKDASSYEHPYGAPHILSISVKDVRAEVLLHALEDKGIYVSSGSACSTHKKTSSDTLIEAGLSKDLLDSTIRVSMSMLTTREDCEGFLSSLHELLPLLRRYRPA